MKLYKECDIKSNVTFQFNQASDSFGILVIDNSDILWLSANGKSVIKRYSCEHVPVCACFCPYLKDSVVADDNSNNEFSSRAGTAVAILLTCNMLRLHMPSGLSFDIQLPCAMVQIYPFTFGLLLQRQDDLLSSKTDPGQLHNHSSPRMVDTSALAKKYLEMSPNSMFDSPSMSVSLSPQSIILSNSRQYKRDNFNASSSVSLYSLSHPLALVRPVGAASNDTTIDALRTPTAKSHQKQHKQHSDEDVVYFKLNTDRIVCRNKSYICTMSNLDGISLYSIQQSLPEQPLDITAASLDQSNSRIKASPAASTASQSVSSTAIKSGRLHHQDHLNATDISGNFIIDANPYSTDKLSISGGTLDSTHTSHRPFSPVSNYYTQLQSINTFTSIMHNPNDTLSDILVGAGGVSSSKSKLNRGSSPSNMFNYQSSGGRSTPTGRATPTIDIIAQTTSSAGSHRSHINYVSPLIPSGVNITTDDCNCASTLPIPEINLQLLCTFSNLSHYIHKHQHQNGIIDYSVTSSNSSCTIVDDSCSNEGGLILHVHHHPTNQMLMLLYNGSSLSLVTQPPDNDPLLPRTLNSYAHATVTLGCSGSSGYKLPLLLFLKKQHIVDDLASEQVISISIAIGSSVFSTSALQWYDDNDDDDEIHNLQTGTEDVFIHSVSDKEYILLKSSTCSHVMSLPSCVFKDGNYPNYDIAMAFIGSISKARYPHLIETILGMMIYVESTIDEPASIVYCLLCSAFSIPLPSRYASILHPGIFHRLSQLCQCYQVSQSIFDVLHMVLEDLRLLPLKCNAAANLASALYAFIVCIISSYRDESGRVVAVKYLTYYEAVADKQKLCNDAWFDANSTSLFGSSSFSKFDAVPSSVAWIESCLLIDVTSEGKCLAVLPVFPFPDVLASRVKCCISLRLCYDLFSFFIGSCAADTCQKIIYKQLSDAFVKCSSGAGGLNALNHMPEEMKALVKISLNLCRNCPNAGWPDEFLLYIGRTDLCTYDSSESYVHMKSSNKLTTGCSSSNTTNSWHVNSGNIPSDGLAEVEQASQQLRFAEDDRVHEVCRMLRSSKHIYLRVDRTPEVSDLDHRHKLQTRLLNICRRTFASCVGRGMLTMGSLEPIMAEALPVPILMLAGRVPPQNTIIALETNNAAPTELTLWPEFHNGVAAGLRVGKKCTSTSSSSTEIDSAASNDTLKPNPFNSNMRITRNWIIYNRTAAAAGNEAGHAGVLFALGLQGYLSVLSVTDICDYLTQGHEPTTVAILIGMAAAKLGSADTLLSKTLCLHLPALLPPRHWDIDISPIVQTAAIVGLGLLHYGSGHRLMTEFLLAEMSRRHTRDCSETREAMVLAVSWALGMVLLGKGSTNSGIDIGNDSTGLSGLADLHIEDRLQQHMDGGKRPPDSHLFPSGHNSSHLETQGTKGSKVLEGEQININLTSPGATIALGMIYIKSNNLDIAKRLSLPSTAFEVDSILPDLLLFRSISRCLVLWDSVYPSLTWLDEQIPEVIMKSIDNLKSEGLDSKHGNSSSQRLPLQNDKILSNKTALCAYLSITAGHCIGLGLVFAGTGNIDAKNTILHKLKLLQSFRDMKPPFGLPLSQDKSIKPLIEMCVSCTSVALSYIMAGTGDIDCLRIFREIRWKLEDVNYGSHMSIGMSIGMLFLAGGNASLKRDPLSIACLLMAVCPRFPLRTTDNQYHLQVLRHMYVIAMENRALRTVDVYTQASVPLNVVIQLKSGDKLSMKAPCLLPEIATIDTVYVDDANNKNQYYSTNLSITENCTNYTLFVKRKPLLSNASPEVHGSSKEEVYNTTGNVINGLYSLLSQSLLSSSPTDSAINCENIVEDTEVQKNKMVVEETLSSLFGSSNERSTATQAIISNSTYVDIIMQAMKQNAA